MKMTMDKYIAILYLFLKAKHFTVRAVDVYPDLPTVAQPNRIWNIIPFVRITNTPERWPLWYFRQIMVHFEMMTEEINKQVFHKLTHAEKYVELDDETNIYMMGKMSESMKERFKNMIMVYKRYNKYTDNPIGHYHVFERQVMALEYIEGEYNRILFERRQFHKALQGYYEELLISSRMAHEATRVIEQRRRGVGRTPRVQDGDYKMQLRKKKFEAKKASFNPEVEGIDIDLGYVN